MSRRTDEREEFLKDVLALAAEAASYWAKCSYQNDRSYIVKDGESGELIGLANLDTIARGLNTISTGQQTYVNHGYAEVDAHRRIDLVNRSNGFSGDYDAIDADAILQIGLLGQITYS